MKEDFKIKDIILEVVCSKNNINIKNSYTTTKKSDIKNALYKIKNSWAYREAGCIVFSKRAIKSLTKEWIAHNVLYKLHIARSHTKSVDLNVERWYRILCYNIIYFVYKLLNYFVSK